MLEQKVDALHTLCLLLALGVGRPARLEPARVRTCNLRLLRGGQPAPLLMRDLVMKGCMHGADDVLEGQVRHRRAPPAVRRERGADDADVDGPLWDRVADDAHARHLWVRRGLLEVVRGERRDVVGACAPLYHQVGDRKIDMEVLGDDFAVDEVVQLRAGQLLWPEFPSR